MGPLFIVTPHWDPTLGRSIAKWVPFRSLLIIWELMRVIKITCNATQGGQAPELKIELGEIGGPPVKPPSRRGFGSHSSSSVLSRSSAERYFLRFAPPGVNCAIQASLKWED